MNEIKAVRVVDISPVLSRQGVAVWLAAAPVDQQGHDQVICVPGLSGDGRRQTVLTFVVKRSRKSLKDGKLQAACLTWARAWFRKLSKAK